MNKEVQSLIIKFQETLNGEPWFGRAVYSILNEIDASKVYQKPNEQSHSLIELLYHMITWTEFTLKRIERDKKNDSDKKDWRVIDPEIHNWENALAEFVYLNNQIIHKLSDKPDPFLEETVDFREYNFRYLIEGLTNHHIYHLGQIAWLSKSL